MSTKTEKPVALKVIPENIPEELKNLRRWAVWRYHKKEDGTYDKPPLQPNGDPANVQDHRTWSSFEAVIRAYPNFDGISILPGEIGPDKNLIGGDADDVKGSNHEEETLKDIAKLNTYTELSPSGEGIRFFAYGAMPGPNHNVRPFEMYGSDARFLSVTGNIIGPQKEIVRATGAISKLYQKWFPEKEEKAKTIWKPSPDMTDSEVLAHLFKATNSEKFSKLYLEGDWKSLGYPSHSEGDEGLCGIIKFYTQKPEQINRIFKTSKMYRPEKWDRDDYNTNTINRVLKGNFDTFQPQSEKKKNTKKKNSASKESETNRLCDDEGNLIPPQHIKDIIFKASEENKEGLEACLKWIKGHTVELASIDKIFWCEINHGTKQLPIMLPPDLVYDIGVAFKLEEEDYGDIYPILKKNNLLYHNTVKKFHKIRVAMALYPEEVKWCAVKELIEGDPYRYIVETWQEKHTGDIGTGKTLPLCAISTLILGENKGLHFKQSGESGKGKTSGIDAFLALLPPSMVIRGSISDKYVYYSPEEDITDGSLIFIDDRELNETLKGVVKTSVSNYQNPEAHRTVIDGKGCVYTPAKRLTWMFASVDGFDDDQLSNRFLMADVDCSAEQDERVAENQRKAESAIFSDANLRVEVCRCIFDTLRAQNYKIAIPYAGALKWHNPENRRNQPKFFDIIRAVCAFKLYQRDKINGYIVATKEDLERAEEIYDYSVKQTKSNLTAQEHKILNLLCAWNEDPEINCEAEDFKQNPSHKTAYKAAIKDIAAALDLPVEKLRKVMEGRAQKGILGLLDRVKGLYKDIEDSGHHTVLYSYTKRLGTFDDLNIFVTYKDRDIEKETNDFLKKLTTHLMSISVETDIERQAFLNISPLSPLLTTQCGEKFFKEVADIFNISKDYTKISNNIYNISHHNLEVCNIEEEKGLDCKKLGSEQSNILQFKSVEDTQKIYYKPEKSGEILEKESTDTENISPLGVERCGESGEILGKMPFVSSTDIENISHTEKFNEAEVQEEKEESQKLCENQFTTIGLADPDRLQRIASRKKKSEPQKGQKTIPEDEDYGDVPGVSVTEDGEEMLKFLLEEGY